MIQHREIVRREIPHDVGVTLHHAETNADRIKVKKIAELPRINQGFDPRHRVGVDERVVDHQRPPVFIREFHQLERLSGTRRQRLLDQHMLSGSECAFGKGIVSCHGSCDHHRLYAPVSQDLLIVLPELESMR